MVVHKYNPSSPGRQKQEDFKFEDIPGKDSSKTLSQKQMKKELEVWFK
jgi:ribosomal protein L2